MRYSTSYFFSLVLSWKASWKVLETSSRSRGWIPLSHVSRLLGKSRVSWYPSIFRNSWLKKTDSGFPDWAHSTDQNPELSTWFTSSRFSCISSMCVDNIHNAFPSLSMVSFLYTRTLTGAPSLFSICASPTPWIFLKRSIFANVQFCPQNTFFSDPENFSINSS